MLRASFLLFGVTGLASCTKAEASLPSPPEKAARQAVSKVALPPVPSASPVSSTPAPVEPAAEEPRVYSKSRFLWIRPEPNTDLQWIGYLWPGGSVRLKSTRVVYGPGCEHWYAIEPRGFVCVDEKRATLDAKDPLLAKIRPYLPRLDTAWPHQYAESLGLARSLPNGAPFALTDLPSAIHENHRDLRPRSTFAYSAEAKDGEHSFLMSADYMSVPKDRVVPYPVVEFQGVELGADAQLPLAFFRSKDRPKYRVVGEGFEPTGELYARLSHVQLTGKQRDVSGETYLEARDGYWVAKQDAVVPTPGATTPWGTPLLGAGAADAGATDAPVSTARDSAAADAGKTWMEASVWGGWLIAYVGTKPVYVTMIAPGRGGTPVRGKDPLETASTPTGVFPISGKFATATMIAPHEFTHSDVPWTQNFSGPHALHGAYWHDDWGNRKSAGCVNVSPKDGRWLFNFTEPKVPEGWHGVRWVPKQGPATLFVIHS